MTPNGSQIPPAPVILNALGEVAEELGRVRAELALLNAERQALRGQVADLEDRLAEDTSTA